MFAGIPTDSRENVSDGIKLEIVGIVKHVEFLRKLLHLDCITICTIPFDSVFMVSIALMG